ncbi:MAG: LD-carboxypeptidase [Acidobacteriota bacterium]|nr:LD-carboxypeptidase [Blastocatellia bacterium]MDW8241301.1 LD-carboxypeptidase [Acidobacteriota bacterium]
MMTKPPRLQLGNTIGVVAPASNIQPALLEAGIRELERLGFRTKFFDSIFDKWRYTAGSDERRAGELNAMFADPDVNAIIAARGGYGTVRLLPLLDRDVIRANPKIFMGYSDISTLLIYFQRMFHWVTFHGPMITREFAGGSPYYDGDLLDRVLCRAEPAGNVDTSGTQILRGGIAQGRLVGGCLPMVTCSLATEYELDTRDTILFLEDYASKPYQIDRMLTHLRLAGKLEHVRGLIFGEMTDCVQHPDQGYTIIEVIHSCLEGLSVPVLFGLRSGHSDVGNLVLPLGVQVRLDCSGAQAVLSIEEAAVS